MNTHLYKHRRRIAASLAGVGTVAVIGLPGAIGFAEEKPLLRSHPTVRLVGIQPLEQSDDPRTSRGSSEDLRYVPSIPPPFDPLNSAPPSTGNGYGYGPGPGLAVDPSRPTLPLQKSLGPLFQGSDASRPRPFFGANPQQQSPMQQPPLQQSPMQAGYAPRDNSPFAFPTPNGGANAVAPQNPSPNPNPNQTPSKGFTGWINDRTKAIREVFTGPQQPPPQPRVGNTAPQVAQAGPMQPQPGSSWNPYAPFPAGNNAAANRPAGGAPAFRGPTPSGQMGYAGNPAYRWYGWGTTTPGANPYAPTGDYPQGSAGWYAMTGATPGAFPTPVVNAFRPPPGNEPPNYIAQNPPHPVSTSAGSTAVAVGPSLPRPSRPIAQSQPSRPVPQVPYVPPIPDPGGKPVTDSRLQVSPIPAAPAPSSPTPVSAPNVTPIKPSPVEPKWQPSHTPPGSFMSRGQAPEESKRDEWQELTQRIQKACEGLATRITVTPQADKSLKIGYDCPNEELARWTARVLSEMPELKPYKVVFTGRLPH